MVKAYLHTSSGAPILSLHVRFAISYFLTIRATLQAKHPQLECFEASQVRLPLLSFAYDLQIETH